MNVLPMPEQSALPGRERVERCLRSVRRGCAGVPARAGHNVEMHRARAARAARKFKRGFATAVSARAGRVWRVGPLGSMTPPHRRLRRRPPRGGGADHRPYGSPARRIPIRSDRLRRSLADNARKAFAAALAAQIPGSTLEILARTP